MIKTPKFYCAFAMLFTATLLTATQASAITTYPWWYTDESPGISVDYNGLEWLTWDQTIDMSIDDALCSYSGDGWRLASISEVSSLFQSLFTGPDVIGDDFEPLENEYQSNWDPAEHGNSSYFTSNFGLTDYACDPSGYHGCLQYTSALFGDDLDNDGLYNRANFRYTQYDDNSFSDAIIESDQFSRTETFASLENSNFRSHGTGVALVRSPGGGPITQAPEISAKGATLAFTLLFALLLLARERKAKKTAFGF